MAYAALSQLPTTAGMFVEADTHNTFEYSVPCADAPWPEYPHRVWVSLGTFRWGKILSTVAYVVTDEAADGSPVTERWRLTKRRLYLVDL